MPKIDITITISVVIAICSIISPVITTLLNNRHQYKMKKIDAKLEAEKASAFYKRGVYEKYLSITGELISNKSFDTLNAYGEIYPLALVYFPDSLRQSLLQLDSLIVQLQWESARPILHDLTNEIRTILQTL